MSLLNYGKISTIESFFLLALFFRQFNTDLYYFIDIMLMIEKALEIMRYRNENKRVLILWVICCFFTFSEFTVQNAKDPS